MKKKFRIAIIMGPQHITRVYQTMILAFGKENVARSMRPEDLFGILKQLHPTTLIIEPELFHLSGISPEDIKAYQKTMRYRILAVYPTEESLQARESMAGLDPEKEYIRPVEYLSMAEEIPKLCTNKYVKVKEPLQEATVRNIEQIFRKCEFHCNAKGAPLVMEALYKMYFDPDLHRRGGFLKIYTELSEKYGYPVRIVERSMIRFLEDSMSPRTEELLRKELNIPDCYQFFPMSFGRFTETFITYYCDKYSYPERILAYPRKELPDFF